MEGIKSLYRIGNGPSSSHTLGPARGAELFLGETDGAEYYTVDLYGSLALTGKGHGTDRVLEKMFGSRLKEVNWYKEKELEQHPNGMVFSAWNTKDEIMLSREVYSTGGGRIVYPGFNEVVSTYSLTSLQDILDHCKNEGIPLWEYAYATEPGLEAHLADVWEAMSAAVKRGLAAEGVLPGGLKLGRKASTYEAKLRHSSGVTHDYGYLFASALAVSEENAAGGVVVTAPTCGGSGVLPAVLTWFRDLHDVKEQRIYRALATAGLIGILVRHNASISGAEVGCQGEVGTACAMAAAAAAHLLGGSPFQVEYAAEMGLEHHLGLTCDPVMGLVQIPCIERNAMAAARAVEIAVYSLLSDGRHAVSFDQVVETMYRTGKDLTRDYRETALGGLARFYRHPLK